MEPQFVKVGGVVEVHFCLNSERSEEVVAELRYALNEAAWCQSDGSEGEWESTQQVAVPPEQGEAVTFSVSDLKPGTTYCFEAFAFDGSGEFNSQRLFYQTYGSGEPVPELVEPPTITGNAVEGQTLTAVPGVWSNEPEEYKVQWERCNSNEQGCEPIVGETAETYAVTAADVGNTIRVTEIAVNAAGESRPASSVARAVVGRELVPKLVQAPTISGSTIVGQTLTEVHGEWSEKPTEYAVQWERCNSNGEDCVTILGETSQSYLLQVADIGYTIRATETATNSTGSSVPSSSIHTTVVKEPLPVLLKHPTITGSAIEGQTLAVVHGEWLNHPTAYMYQWVLCNASGENCEPIAGATAQTYLLTAADVGRTLKVTETATNGTGFSTAASETTAVVQAEPAPKAKEPEQPSGNSGGTGSSGDNMPVNIGIGAGSKPPPPGLTVIKCLVPKLKGKTLAKAKKLLGENHCKLGRVSSPKTHSHKEVVISQKLRAGTVQPTGAKVAVRLS